MKAEVTFLKGMTFQATDEKGFELTLGTGFEDQERQGLSPMGLILIGLAGCTAIDVISILRKQRQDVTGFKIEVEGERAQDHPRVYTHIQLKYIITGHNLEEKSVERAIELSSTKYCSVHAMLVATVEISTSYQIIEAASEASSSS
jgi:putative redox protein